MNKASENDIDLWSIQHFDDEDETQRLFYIVISS